MRDSAWNAFWAVVDGEDWLAAKALLDLSDAVRRDAAQWLRTDAHGDLSLDWDGWVGDVDERGRGWSSTEHHLFQVVAALVIPGRPVPLTGVLDRMGSWETDVLKVLVEWATGGNNRDLPGRASVTAQTYGHVSTAAHLLPTPDDA